jgi:hypothetical protein
MCDCSDAVERSARAASGFAETQSIVASCQVWRDIESSLALLTAAAGELQVFCLNVG